MVLWCGAGVAKMKLTHGADQDGDKLKAFAEELEALLHAYGFQIHCFQDFAALSLDKKGKSELEIRKCRSPDLWAIDHE